MSVPLAIFVFYAAPAMLIYALSLVLSEWEFFHLMEINPYSSDKARLFACLLWPVCVAAMCLFYLTRALDRFDQWFRTKARALFGRKGS